MNRKRCGSIHKIRDVKLDELSLSVEYDILRSLGQGCYGRVQLALHKSTGSKIALKLVRQEATNLKDFLREFHYSYFLSPHQNILMSYDVAFQTRSCYVFAQEFAPCGDLSDVLKETPGGMDESRVKSMSKQVASALDFMHSKELVHRDIKPQNILVFDRESSLVKLTDFGLTRKAGTLVKKTNVCLPYLPPEICEAVCNEGYHVDASSDVWQLAMLVFCCLTASLPWQRADITDANFTDFVQWQKRKTTKTTRHFRLFSSRLLRMFRRMLESKPEKRPGVKELYKYLQDKWVLKATECGGTSKERDSDSSQQSQRSRRASNADHKAGLGTLLMSYGITTTIDREEKYKRVHDWILAASP